MAPLPAARHRLCTPPARNSSLPCHWRRWSISRHWCCTEVCSGRVVGRRKKSGNVSTMSHFPPLRQPSWLSSFIYHLIRLINLSNSQSILLFFATVTDGFDPGTLDDLRASTKGGLDPGGLGASLLATDVLWSDPVKDEGFCENFSRGIGMVFGADVTEVRMAGPFYEASPFFLGSWLLA
jgi:hypothetical protein